LKCLSESRELICNLAPYESTEAAIVCCGCGGIDQTTEKINAALAPKAP
jgi:hypothetical protein